MTWRKTEKSSIRQNHHDHRAIAGKCTKFVDYALLPPQVTAMHFPGKNVAFFISNIIDLLVVEKYQDANGIAHRFQLVCSMTYYCVSCGTSCHRPTTSVPVKGELCCPITATDTQRCTHYSFEVGRWNHQRSLCACRCCS